MTRSAGLKIALVLLLVPSAFSYGQSTPALSDPVMRAMADELERSIAELQFKDLDKPYFIQYIVLDQEEYRGSATFGALTASDRDRARIEHQIVVTLRQRVDRSPQHLGNEQLCRIVPDLPRRDQMQSRTAVAGDDIAK